MTTQWDRRGGSGSAVFFTFLLALLLGAVALAMFLRSAHAGVTGRLAAAILRRPVVIDVSAPVVVDRIQHLARLESVVYSLDTVVEGSKSSAILPDALAGDRLLLIVHGQTVAGIDLSKLKPEDVQITPLASGGRAVHVTLPPSEVFSTTVDEQHTRVYERTTGLLTSADPNLESTTRASAQSDIAKAALTDGILDVATKNARTTVTALLQGLGFAQVEVR